MAKKKPPSGQRLKSIRHGLSTLKAAGLYNGDAKRAKGGWRQVKLLNEYKDVVQGKAKSVRVGNLKQAKSYPPEMKPRNGRVVVPAKPHETVRFEKKAKRVVKYTTRKDGTHVKTIYPAQKINTVSDLPDPPKGKKYFYQVQFNYGRYSPTFQDKFQLAEYMQPYKEKHQLHRKRGGTAEFRDWLDCVVIMETEPRT